MTWIAVAAGGAIGSLARHAVNLVFSHLTGSATPWATATVNVFGSLAIGVLAGLTAAGRLHLSPPLRTFIFVGILGGFTTFSSFMLDTLTLGHGTHHRLAIGNLAAQLVLGCAAVFLGYAAAR
jgi:CrcB protein